MIEAEFHVLWRSTDGQFHDVTPNAIPFERVLFLPDPSLTYEEKQVDNIRRPIISDPRIVKFISAAEEVFAINNAGDRASKFEIHVTQEEAQTLRSLQMLRAQLVMQIEASFPGRNELCRCGSGKKFKRCCSGS
jgi:uncharacterized protein YecA (UPF0149 family)